MDGGKLINFNASVRPTRNRLLAAMGLSAGAVALLLALPGSLFEFAVDLARPGLERADPLTVQIRADDREEISNIQAPRDNDPSPAHRQFVSTDIEIESPGITIDDSAESSTDLPAVTDWHAISDDVAKATVDEYSRLDASREAMWRQSYSLMFEPSDDGVSTDIEPLLADVRFRQRSRVIGLGLNIGACFFGIPIAGVPVEERTVGISIFVCKQGSG